MSEGRPSFRLVEEKKDHNVRGYGCKSKGTYATRSSAVHKEGIALPHAVFLVY